MYGNKGLDKNVQYEQQPVNALFVETFIGMLI